MSQRRIHPKAQAILEGSNAERIEYILSDKWIDYPAASVIMKKMNALIAKPKSIRNQGILIYGESNNGKTSLLHKFYREHKPGEYTNEDGNIILARPVILVQAPPTPDETRLYSVILSDLFAPFRDRDPVDKKYSLTEHYLKVVGAKVLIIDEIHNVLSGSYAKQRTFMNALKNISNSLSLSIVLSGTKDALAAINVDSQISSRFKPYELPTWKNEKTFASFIATYETLLPLKKESRLAHNSETLNRIHTLSDGCIGKAIEIIKNASIEAIESGTEVITAKDLSYGQ